MGGQAVVTDLEDLALEVHPLATGVARIGLFVQHHVGGDERTGDGTSPGSHHGHADGRVSVDRGLDFLRVDLQSSDVDEAAPAAEEVVPVAAALHHVAGVDEAFLIGEHGIVLAEIADGIPRGTDPQRTLDDLDLHVAGRADQARRKPLQTIAHFESHAGLRGGEGMSDAGLRVERMESVQDPLVGDLSGEADVARRDGGSVRAHQRTTPMRGGSRNMRRPLRPEPHEIIADRLAGAGKHEGAGAQDGPEKDLEPSIPANVVERAPHHVRALSQGAADGRGQAGEAVNEHLGRAGRAGGEEHPLGSAARGRRLFGGHDFVADHPQGNARWVIAAIVIRDDRLHARFRDHGGTMLGRQVRWADDEAAGHSVQLDERERRGKLIPGGDENGPLGQLRHAAAEPRAAEMVAERNAGRGTPQEALRALRRVTQPVANRRHGTGRRVHRT